MYTAIPGRTGALVAHIKSAKTKPARKPEVHGTPQMACNHMFNLAQSKADWYGPFKSDDEIGQERRKCQHSNLRRRGRRAVEIFR